MRHVALICAANLHPQRSVGCDILGPGDLTLDSCLCDHLRTVECSSDYRSSNVAPSDSERDCSATLGPRLAPAPAPDSESGGEQSPSPRAARKRQVRACDCGDCRS